MARRLLERYHGAALVTGASSGLGAAFARQIAKEGMDVVLVARRRDRLETLAASLRGAHDVRTWVIAQDLSEADAPARIKARLDAIAIGLLVNNAGFGSHGLFHEQDLAAELRMVDLNCRAFVGMTSVFVPSMVQRRNGAVIFVSSTAAFGPVPRFATYGATKAFDLSFGQAVADDLRGTGVDVLTFCPGYTRSEFHHAAGVQNLPDNIVWSEPDDAACIALRALGRRSLEIVGASQPGSTDVTRQLVERLSRRFVAGVKRFRGTRLTGP